MGKLLVILENDDVVEEQNLSQVTKKLIGNVVNTIIFEPVTGFKRDLPPGIAGIIVGGGLPSVNDPRDWINDEIRLIMTAAARGVPILGICFGHQLISKAFGSRVVRRERRIGFAEIVKVKDDPIFEGISHTWRSPVYHQDRVESPPNGFELIATSSYCTVQAMAHKELPIWTVQFHPEINYGINRYFTDPVEEWNHGAAFEPIPNRRIIDNFLEICLR